MTVPEVVTTDWLFGGNVGMRFLAHLNGGDHSQISRDLVVRATGERLGMMVADVSVKPAGRKRWGNGGRTWFVDGVDAEFASAEDALTIFNRRRREAATDKEWEAARPSSDHGG